MNRLVIIGNGFDIAHGLKSSYLDFINWYWDNRVEDLAKTFSKVSEDCLCKLTIKDNVYGMNWNGYISYNAPYKDYYGRRRYPGHDLIVELEKNPKQFSVEYSPFFKTILQSIESKGWVDIENDYYQLLKRCVYDTQCDYSAADLNKQLSFLQTKLVEYLGTLSPNGNNDNLLQAMICRLDPTDFSTENKKRALNDIGLHIESLDDLDYNPENYKKLKPKQIMLLCFNYTNTAKLYNNFNITHNYIHGDLEHPKHIIFGYGDELDKNYQDILDKNDNELLRNVKSVKYLETRHYRDLLEFLMSAPFQVLIMGHSCGNSDRTLLNTVFEHENCVSIKPYYHIWEDGSDNYLDIIQNISRNFTDMKLFRDRVVNKEQCKTM